MMHACSSSGAILREPARLLALSTHAYCPCKRRQVLNLTSSNRIGGDRIQIRTPLPMVADRERANGENAGHQEEGHQCLEEH